MNTITLAAPAKINLILRVLGRAPNGYHYIETVFQRLALADSVRLTVTDGGCSLDVAWDGLPAVDIGPTEKNLAWRAAAAYRRATGWPVGWTIELTKRVPAGAGLGGGSSDAAAVLMALNRLATRPMDQSDLHALAVTLGADVAFFVSGASCALGRGFGEVLSVLPSLPRAQVALIVPTFGVSTAEAYAELDQAPERPAARGAGPEVNFSSWVAVAAAQENDFEQTVFARHPSLRATRDALERAGASVARLSGTGSVVFGLWSPGSDRALSIDAPKGNRVVLTETA